MQFPMRPMKIITEKQYTLQEAELNVLTSMESMQQYNYDLRLDW